MNDDVTAQAHLLGNASALAAAAALLGIPTALQRTQISSSLSDSAASPASSPQALSTNSSSPGSLLDFSGQTYSSNGLVGSIGAGNAGTDDQPASLPASVNIVLGACLIVISFLGASFNAFMIVAIAPNRRLRTVRNILLVHLGAVGLLSSMFTTAYPAIATFHGHWLGGRHMCQTYAFVTCVFTSVSVWTIAALSWDKYQTIASPLHHSLTATLDKMLPCFLAFWACGLMLSLPPLLGANEFVFHHTMGICGVDHSSSRGRWYTCLLVAASFVLPFCLMIYCYAHIFRIARTQSSRIAATMLRMVSVIQAPIAAPAVSSSQGSSSLSLRGTKAMGTIMQLIGSFVLTYLPYSIIVLYEVFFSVHANAVFVAIATSLFLAAPFTHAAIYGLRNQILRTSFYRYSRRKFQDLKTRRAPFCWYRCCKCFAKDKRRNSVKQPSCSNNRHSMSYMKRGSMAAPQPVRCVVQADGKQYVLRRALSYHDYNYSASLPGYQNNKDLRQTQMNDEAQAGVAKPVPPTGDRARQKVSLPRPHSLSDVSHQASVLRLANTNAGLTCYPTSPLLLHASSGKLSQKHQGYSSLLEECVGAGHRTTKTSPPRRAACAINDLSTYHIPACRAQDRRDKIPGQTHRNGYSPEQMSVFSKDILEELSQMDEEMEDLGRADCEQPRRLSRVTIENFIQLNCDTTSSKHERSPASIPRRHPTSPTTPDMEKIQSNNVSRTKKVRDGLIVKLSQLAATSRLGKPQSIGSAGSHGMGSVDGSSVFDIEDGSPEPKSSVFESCPLNELASVMSIEEPDGETVLDYTGDLELSNFQLEPDRAVHIVSSQV